MTQSAFLSAYEAELLARYEWPFIPGKLASFLASTEATLNGASSWSHDGEAVTAAWKAIGGKGKPTLKALRALPK